MAAKSRDNRVNNLIWGVLLSLAGVGLLLFNLDVFVRFEPYVQYGAAALLGLLALLFVGGYLSARENWWRLIPGWTLIALAAMVYLTTLPALDQRITASVLFVGQAIAFAHIYLLDRAERWWAIIPGGFMLMLGGTIALSSLTEEPSVLGTVLFIGLGAVFFLLYLLGQRWQLWWALVPGSVLVLLGLFLFSIGLGQQNLPLRLWPVLLPLLGAWLIWRATRPLPGSKLNVDAAPSQSRSRSQTSEGSARPRRLGEYSGPAPGATVEVLPDPEEAQ
ncbi:MAG: hypothetical protein OXJ55_01485 [Caldilineaceae bacterium]|nr:hypothetical protein [Caldilineaceae bacterium]